MAGSQGEKTMTQPTSGIGANKSLLEPALQPPGLSSAPSPAPQGLAVAPTTLQSVQPASTPARDIGLFETAALAIKALVLSLFQKIWAYFFPEKATPSQALEIALLPSEERSVNRSV
jgi:hypothetical protein